MALSAQRRVLMLVENTAYPQDRRIRGEAQALSSAGYQVSVICQARAGQPWRESVEGVFVYRYPPPRGGRGTIGYAWEYGYSMLAAFLLSVFVFLVRGFDVIHAANPPDTFVLIALPYKLMGRRFVFDHHDLAPEQYQARFRGHSNRLAYFTLVSLEKLSCRVADHVITTNESYKAMEMRRGGVPAERITVVRNGPVLGEYHLAEPDPGLRQKGKTIIGYVGVIGVQDGVDYLLRALGHLVVDLGRQNVFCVIIGRGEALEGLRVLASELGLEELVWFAGWMWPSDFIPYLSAADICVVPDPSNPYNDRSTMIKVMEYMALGKPIVAFDLPENRFSAQDAALYVRPNNELEFAKALAELMDDPERRRTMGEFGYRRVRDQLAWEYSAANLLRAYGSLWADSRQVGAQAE